MYWLCMIATIPLATGNKLNCFISARGMLAIVWHCVLLFCWGFFVDFLHVNKSSSQKKQKQVMSKLSANLAHISNILFSPCKLGDSNVISSAYDKAPMNMLST